MTVRRTRMKELADEGSRTARSVVKITSDPPHFIAAMQLGVTLTSLAIGALGERVLAELFDQWLATILAVLLAFLDHHVPARRRRRARPQGARAQLRGAHRARRVRARSPVLLRVQAADLGAPAVERARAARDRVDPTFTEGEAHSEAELKMLLEVSTEHGEIEKDEREMLYKVFDFAEKEAAT